MVYKPTPKSLLASSSSYSPPIKKPKLEYVPKSVSNSTSNATYIPSTSIKSNSSDNEGEAQKSGWDYLSEIIESEPSTNIDKTITYVPTKINRQTSEDVANLNDVNVVKPTENANENKLLIADETEIKKDKSKQEKTKSHHDRHKSSSKSSSRSHSHSNNKRDTSSSTSSERSKSSKSTGVHRSSHDKSKSNSSRSDSKSSLDRNGSESKRSDKNTSTTSKSSRSSSKHVDKKHDGDEPTRKSKSNRTSSTSTKKESVEIAPVTSSNISPSSIFDTDSEEDDVMAQCRMIFEEFKEVSNNEKLNDVVVSVFK